MNISKYTVWSNSIDLFHIFCWLNIWSILNIFRPLIYGTHTQRKYSRSAVSLPWLRSVTFGGASIMPQQLRLTLSTDRRTQKQRLEKLTDTRATDPHASVKRHRHDLWTSVPPTHEVFPVRDRGSWRSLVLMSRKLDMCNRHDDLIPPDFTLRWDRWIPRENRFLISTPKLMFVTLQESIDSRTIWRTLILLLVDTIISKNRRTFISSSTFNDRFSKFNINISDVVVAELRTIVQVNEYYNNIANVSTSNSSQRREEGTRGRSNQISRPGVQRISKQRKLDLSRVAGCFVGLSRGKRENSKG